MPASTHSELLAEGLTLRRNKNGFTVLRLHYTADPAKRSPEWIAEARSGMDEARFLREYEIDYGAARGRKVFPEIALNRSSIVVSPPYPTFPSSHPFYGGFDYGLRNPSAFLVFTWWDSILYCVWELYKPCLNIFSFADEMRSCPYWSQIRWIAADPHIADRRYHNSIGNPSSILNQFIEAGITRLSLAPNSEEAWLALIRQYWSGEPRFRIFSSCVNTIREFEEAVYDEPLTTRRPHLTEHIADYNNHALDACKYFMLSSPRSTPSPTFTPPPRPSYRIR